MFQFWANTQEDVHKNIKTEQTSGNTSEWCPTTNPKNSSFIKISTFWMLQKEILFPRKEKNCIVTSLVVGFSLLFMNEQNGNSQKLVPTFFNNSWSRFHTAEEDWRRNINFLQEQGGITIPTDACRWSFSSSISQMLLSFPSISGRPDYRVTCKSLFIKISCNSLHWRWPLKNPSRMPFFFYNTHTTAVTLTFFKPTATAILPLVMEGTSRCSSASMSKTRVTFSLAWQKSTMTLIWSKPCVF